MLLYVEFFIQKKEKTPFSSPGSRWANSFSVRQGIKDNGTSRDSFQADCPSFSTQDIMKQ